MNTLASTRGIVRLARGAALAAALAVLAVVVMPAPAGAAVGDFVCTVSAQDTYSPGLMLTPQLQHQTFNVGYSNCVSSSHPSVTAGTRSTSRDEVNGCLVAPTGGPATTTITWNTGQTSTFAGTRTRVSIGGQAVFTWQGTVTAGLFVGAGFTEVISQNSLNLLACAVPPGVTSQSGTGTLVSS